MDSKRSVRENYSSRLRAQSKSQPSRTAPITATKKLPFTSYVKSSCYDQPTSHAARSRNQRNSNLFVDYSMTKAELHSCVLSEGGQKRRGMANDCSSILHNQPDPDARKKYLTARSASTPREKYFFPVATSYRYGWLTEHDVDTLHSVK